MTGGPGARDPTAADSLSEGPGARDPTAARLCARQGHDNNVYKQAFILF